MIIKPRVLAICGSTRKTSSNLTLIHFVKSLTKDIFDIEIFEGLTQLPHFNPDLDTEAPPQEIIAFRNKLSEADGVLICTPEYAIGVPGTLKNALDWTVSSMEFSRKPVILITASSSGEIAHASLLGTLLILESYITSETQLHIPFVKTKIDVNGIKEEETLAKVKWLIEGFQKLLSNDLSNLMPAPGITKR